MAEKEKYEQEEFVNPIDADKVAENPHSLPYAHTVGGVEIKPVDRGRLKGRAVTSMYEQTDMQLDQIRQQIELLAQQARKIKDRVTVSELIYGAEMNFEPLVGFTYHLYQRSNAGHVLSMIGPGEWGPNPPYRFVATARMLADHTWDVLEMGEDTHFENGEAEEVN